MKDVITDNYKLLHGDCLERMKEIPDGSVDLILTDPPYQTTNLSAVAVKPPTLGGGYKTTHAL